MLDMTGGVQSPLLYSRPSEPSEQEKTADSGASDTTSSTSHTASETAAQTSGSDAPSSGSSVAVPSSQAVSVANADSVDEHFHNSPKTASVEESRAAAQNLRDALIRDMMLAQIGELAPSRDAGISSFGSTNANAGPLAGAGVPKAQGDHPVKIDILV